MFLGRRLLSVLLYCFAFLAMPLANAEGIKGPFTFSFNPSVPALGLDLYEPSSTQPTDQRPLAVLIHGGGWNSGSRQDLAFLAQWLASQGMIAATIDYRLAPADKWPAQGIDVLQAVWWLRNNAAHLGINPNKVVAIGASAGGQLAGMLGVTNYPDPSTGVPSQVQAVVSGFGPWNLTNLTSPYMQSVLSDLFPSQNGQLIGVASASPIYYVKQASPPVLFFHGTDDNVVPYQQSLDACKAYKAAQSSYFNLVKWQGIGHTLPSDIDQFYVPLKTFLTNWYFNSLQQPGECPPSF